jgi:uncharacterized membrane protein YhiD involved in acid resistance
VIATLLMLVIELVLSRFEYFIMSTARGINLYVEYKNTESLTKMTEYLRLHKVSVTDLQITKSGSEAQNPCAIFSLELTKKMPQNRVLTALSKIDGVRDVEEL